MNALTGNSTATPAANSAAVTTCTPDADGTQYTYNPSTQMCDPVATGGRRKKTSRKARKTSRKASRKGSRKGSREGSRKGSRKNRKSSRKTSRKGSRRN